MLRVQELRSAAVVGLIACITGCGAEPTKPVVDGGNNTVAALFAITYPLPGAKVEPKHDSERSVPVGLDVRGYTVKSSCGGAANCGHLRLNIDGADCNVQQLRDGGQSSWNNLGSDLVTNANFRDCQQGVQGPAKLNGPHTIQVGLFGDDGQPIKDSAGTSVGAKVDVTTAGSYVDFTLKHRPGDLPWLATGFQNMKIQRIEGSFGSLFDPPAPFMIRLKFTPYSVIPLHKHLAHEQVTILDGTFHIVHGGIPAPSPLDPAMVNTFHAGSYFNIPGGHTMWLFFGPRGAIIQVHGVGPNNMNPIQPISKWKDTDGGVLYLNPTDPIFDYCPADGGVGDGGCGGGQVTW